MASAELLPHRRDLRRSLHGRGLARGRDRQEVARRIAAGRHVPYHAAAHLAPVLRVHRAHRGGIPRAASHAPRPRLRRPLFVRDIHILHKRAAVPAHIQPELYYLYLVQSHAQRVPVHGVQLGAAEPLCGPGHGNYGFGGGGVLARGGLCAGYQAGPQGRDPGDRRRRGILAYFHNVVAVHRRARQAP